MEGSGGLDSGEMPPLNESQAAALWAGRAQRACVHRCLNRDTLEARRHH